MVLLRGTRKQVRGWRKSWSMKKVSAWRQPLASGSLGCESLMFKALNDVSNKEEGQKGWWEKEKKCFKEFEGGYFICCSIGYEPPLLVEPLRWSQFDHIWNPLIPINCR